MDLDVHPQTKCCSRTVTHPSIHNLITPMNDSSSAASFLLIRTIDEVNQDVCPPCSLCGIVPGLSSVLLPRMNPFVLINLAGALSLCITYMLIEVK